MGCGAIDVKELGLKDLELSDIQNMNLDLKNSLIYYVSPKIPKFAKLGLYIETIYYKKRGLEKVIKYSKKKFFIINDTKKSFNDDLLITKFLEKFPQFIKNYDDSKNLNAAFSPNNLLTDNYSKLFESLNIEVNNKNNFAICFINEKDKEENILSKLNLIKEKFEKNFYIYKIKSKEDKYAKNEQYTLFFRENKINFWLENDLYNNNCFDFLLNYNQIQNKIKDSNDAQYLINKDSIKNYLNNHSKLEDEYIIKNKYYEFYGKDGNLTTVNDFPTFILKPDPSEFFNEQIIFIASKQKININNYITNEIKKINPNIIINKIEVFKERTISFLVGNYFISKKKYTLYFNTIELRILYSIIKEIDEKINLYLKNINNNYSIENIIVTPKVNANFFLYEENKFVYIIINYSTCVHFVKKKLHEKYGEIYGYDTIKFICIYKDNHGIDLNIINDNDEIKFLNEKEMIRDNNNVDFYIYSFNPINYFSHILIIVNQEGIIQYSNHFKNRAGIFYNYLKEKNLDIKEDLPLLDVNSFKNVKNFFKNKMKVVLDNININNDEDIIDYNEENFFDNYYKNNIFYQPYLSLKYNKINNIENKSEKKYKNYSLNYINFQNIIEMPFDEKEHKPLNEISHIYYEKDAYIQNKKELRCKECFAKLSNKKKYIFYFCPIAKDVICEKCYKKNKYYETSYPFNLLYIKCKNKDIFDNLPKENISLFRDRIKYEYHPEIMDEICDMCSKQLSNYESKSFNVLVNIIRKNNFLICNNCFELLNDEKRSWNYDYKYNFMNELILNNFIDLDNLIFKKVNFN